MSASFSRKSEDRAGNRLPENDESQRADEAASVGAQDGRPQLSEKEAGAVATTTAPSTKPSPPAPSSVSAQQSSAGKAITNRPRVEEFEFAKNGAPGKTPAAKKGDEASKTQKTKDSTQKLNLSKWGLSSKAAGDGKTPGAAEQAKVDKKNEKAAKKTAAAKVAPPEEPKDTAELRVVFPHDAPPVPRVDIIAVHDIDETLLKAWVYRGKKSKRRVNESRAVHASAGINSFDGEGGLGTTGSPAPGRYKSRQPASSGKRKATEESNYSIERWLAVSAKPAVEEDVPQDAPLSEPPLDDPGPSIPDVALAEEPEDTSILGMLASVPEDDDASPGGQTPDDIFWRRRMRRRPTFPHDRKKPASRFASIAEEEKVSSVGEIGDSRRPNPDVWSDRQSSLDQGIERRVNWLSDLDMLPSEIPGARIMCYTYKGVEKVASAWHYLTELADDLVRRIIEKRTSDSVDYNRVPITLIGLGFGALILQRAVNLLAIRSGSDRDPTTNLRMVAGVILLDAPAASADRERFPRSRAQEAKKTWTQDWLTKPRASGATSTKIDTLSMWTRFSSVASAHDIPILWHYSLASTAGRTAITPKGLDVQLVPKQSSTAHRLSRFEGPNDVDYRSIVDGVKRSLIVRLSVTKIDKMAECLADFLKDKFPVDLRDQLNQTALHLAVKAANPEAVKRLLYQGKASVTRKDIEGRSALNIAVQEAANWSPDPVYQQVYTQIINVLMKSGAHVDDRDNDGKTPWSYAEGEGLQWIRRLKDKHLVIGSSSTSSRGAESVLPPQPGPQREACNAFDMILAEVFLQKKRERFSEILNFDMASVYDIIYRGTSSVSRILAASRPEHLTEDKIRCRWIHVPSNNEQWIHDLMVSMDIQDGSMGGQRHEGSRLIDRYMMPQARRYKHFHGRPKVQPEPRPKPNRFGSADSAATVVLGSQDFPPTPEEVRNKAGAKAGKKLVPEFTRTEADAVVIFMPILGFEKHRHRKYLTQAFQEADAAMRIARARDSSPDPKAPSGRKSNGSQKGDRRKTVESSDDGECSSERETSRLYPPVRPVVHARAQVTTGREAQLLSGYLDSKQVKPVHCRRTLDQFSYYMLNSTEARDKSQVAYRWAKNPTVCAEPKNRPIVMVDQLWLWAFHDGTVVTSSPNTWNGQEDFNLSNVLVRELRHNKDRHIIKSVEDLVHLILKTSVDFFQRKGPASFQFHECFQSSINNVSEQQGRLFDNFRNTTKKLHIGALEPKERKREIEFLFGLDQETELLVEIMDIQDELTIVKTILGQQHDVLEKLLRLYPKKADEDADEENRARLTGGLGKGELMVLQSLVQLLRDQTAVGPSPMTPSFRDAFNQAAGLGAQEGQVSRRAASKGKEKEAEQAKATAPPVKSNMLQNRDLMYETIGIVENNMRIVTDMLAYATKVESSLENLLDLKQKHANGWEARFAREGSEETQRQGNIILVFTLVTVVFLPLSFITSFFALEIDIFPKSAETNETVWPVGQVSGYLFGFSAVIFIPLIVLALYVNKLIANIKQTYKHLVKILKEPDDALNPLLPKDTADHDSDEERTFDPRTLANAASDIQGFGYGTRRTSKTNRADSHDGGKDSDSSSYNNSSGDNNNGKSPRYAKLFGRYDFHRAIPLLRDLWRYRRYRLHSTRRRENRWKDRYVRDYPLQYYRTKAGLWAVRQLVGVLAWCGSEKHRRARARDQKRRRRVRLEGVSSSDSSSDDSKNSSSSDSGGGGSFGGGVERKDFGRRLGGNILSMKRKGVKRKKSLDSGYWKQRSGLVGNGSREDDLADMERWSNQTRSRGSFPMAEGDSGGVDEGEMTAGKGGRLEKLGWLRMRRKGRAKGVVIDEEREIGASEGWREKG